MNNTEYYKSLISDEEVIKALIKESKAREGAQLKEKSRVRPNLQFLQRTVTNMVTSNKRIPSTKELLREEAKKPTYKPPSKMKTPSAIAKEILSKDKIEFIRAGFISDESSNSGESSYVKSTENLSEVEKCYRNNLSDNFIRETVTNKSSIFIQNRVASSNNKAKAKIVFNLKSLKGLPKGHENDEQISNVINISTFPANDNDVICISESESE